MIAFIFTRSIVFHLFMINSFKQKNVLVFRFFKVDLLLLNIFVAFSSFFRISHHLKKKIMFTNAFIYNNGKSNFKVNVIAKICMFVTFPLVKMSKRNCVRKLLCYQ